MKLRFSATVALVLGSTVAAAAATTALFVDVRLRESAVLAHGANALADERARLREDPRAAVAAMAVATAPPPPPPPLVAEGAFARRAMHACAKGVECTDRWLGLDEPQRAEV